MTDTYKIQVCTCCMIAAVNGEPCDCCYGVEEHQGCDDHPAGLMGKLLRSEHPVLISDESYFSWSGCDGCGSNLGGDRWEMVVCTN